jgi:hypothetical protein
MKRRRREQEERIDGLHEAGGGTDEDLCSARPDENPRREGSGQDQPGHAGCGQVPVTTSFRSCNNYDHPSMLHAAHLAISQCHRYAAGQIR